MSAFAACLTEDGEAAGPDPSQDLLTIIAMVLLLALWNILAVAIPITLDVYVDPQDTEAAAPDLSTQWVVVEVDGLDRIRLSSPLVEEGVTLASLDELDASLERLAAQLPDDPAATRKLCLQLSREGSLAGEEYVRLMSAVYESGWVLGQIGTPPPPAPSSAPRG